MAFGWENTNHEKTHWAQMVCGMGICLPLIFLAGWVIILGIQFDRKCGGYLKRAADANTVQLAEKELSVAISYLEGHSMTQGFTSIVYETPDEDVGFWYSNLKSSLTELRGMSEKTTQLERSNVLMKLRETLLDDTQTGVKVTVPKGVHKFPRNMMFAVFLIISGVAFVFGLFMTGAALKTRAPLIEVMIIIATIAVIGAAFVTH